jgi:hypothetical protein
MKPVPTRAGVILSILPLDRWNHIRYAAEKISCSSELTISARIHWSTDAPRETTSKERHRILRILVAGDAYASVAPFDSFFQMQEKTTVNHVLIATHPPKRPRNSVAFEGTSTSEKLSSNAMQKLLTGPSTVLLLSRNCIVLY